MTNRDVKPGPLTYEPGVWYDWSGGPNPVPGRLVDWRNRSGMESSVSSDRLSGWEWPHPIGRDNDIIAFRLVEAPADQGSSADADTHRATDGAVVAPTDRFSECYENGAHPNCRRCYRGEVPGMSDDSGFWVEMGAVAGGANEHGLNGWLEMIEHHPDGREVRREYVATDSPKRAPEQPSASVPAEAHGTGVVGLTDAQMVQCFRDHYSFALKGSWPGVQTPHYALAGLFKMAADRIEALSPPPAASVSMGTSRKASETKAAVEGVSAELLEVLEPFAKVGAQMMLTPDHRPLTLSGKAVEHDGALSNGTWTSLTAGAFRRATAALAKATALEVGQ